MTWADVITYVVMSAVGIVIAAVVLNWVMDRKTRDLRKMIEQHAANELETMRQTRLTMEDLGRRDPQIAEMIEFEIGQLDRREPMVAALAAGDYQELRRLMHTAERG